MESAWVLLPNRRKRMMRMATSAESSAGAATDMPYRGRRAARFSAGLPSTVPNYAMARIAKHVETEPDAIARIENLACELPTHARVRITMQDGDVLAGTVTERPAVMLFDDINGNC